MNFDKIDLEALQRDLEEFAREQQQRGWFRRNWLWFVPTVLLTVIVVGGGALYWSMFLRITRSAVCRSAMQIIRDDKTLQEALGLPIHTTKWPSRENVPSEGEDSISWSIYGPKGTARAHAKVREVAGKLEIVTLDVKLLPGGKKVMLNAAGDNDAPPADFSSSKTQSNKPDANAPPPEINLVPPAEPPGK